MDLWLSEVLGDLPGEVVQADVSDRTRRDLDVLPADHWASVGRYALGGVQVAEERLGHEGVGVGAGPQDLDVRTGHQDSAFEVTRTLHAKVQCHLAAILLQVPRNAKALGMLEV